MRVCGTFYFTGGFMAQYDGSIRINTKIDISGIAKGYKEMSGAMGSVAQGLDNIISGANKAADAVSKSAKKETESVEELSKSLTDASEDIDTLNNKKIDIKIERWDDGYLPKENLKFPESIDLSATQKASKDIENANKNIGKSTQTAKKDVENLGGSFSRLKEKISELRSKINFSKFMEIPTESLKDLENEYSILELKIQKLAEKQNRFLAIGGKEDSRAYKGMEYDLDNLTQKQDEVLSKIRQIESAESSMIGKTFRNTILILKGGIKDIPIAAAKKGVDGLKSAFMGLGSIGKKSLSFIGSGLKKATSHMLGFGKSAKKSSGLLSTLGSRFKGLALSLLIFNQISKAFNAMVSGMREGFSNLANENASFRNQVNGLKASLLTLKNAFAGAFAPIVQIAIPYIQQLIGWLTSAISAVGQFIAALTGRKTYIKAVKQTAGAFEDAAGAANDAKEAAEGYLSPLDEINKYSDGKDNGAGAGGGGGAGGAGQMFEEVPIESKFQNFVDKLKSFIKSEDWEGLGAFMASGINKGLQKIYDVINWDNVGPRITYFVNAFTRTFNSLVDNIDWDLLGRTIGAGINTIVNTLNLLIEGIDWKNLGKKIAEGIMGLVREVNWENLGRFFGNRFMILWNTLYGLVMNLKYDEIGVAIGNGLNGAVKAINLGTVGATLGKAITGVFETVINFADTFDWKALGRNISSGINNFFRQFDGKTVAQGLTKLISGILDTLLEIIATTDWTAIGRDIVDFIVNINWLELTGKFVMAALALIGGLVDGIVQAIAETDWGAVWDSILQAFKDFFGIHSPSTVMKEMGGFLVQGLIDGINGLIDGVKQIWENMKQSALGAWNSVKESLSNTWSNIKQTAAQTWESIKQNLTEKWDSLKTGAKTTFDSIKSTIRESWSNIKSNVREAAENVKTNVVNAWTKAKENTASAWSSIKDKATSAVQSMSRSISDKYGYLQSVISNFSSNAQRIWANAWDGMKSKVSSILSSISSTINSVFNNIRRSIGNVSGSLRGVASRAASVGNYRMRSYSSPAMIFPEKVPDIPGYATGQVIPRSMKQHLAILGDNNRETEVVSPLSTIKQANRESLLEVLSELGLRGNNGSGIPQTIIIKQYLDGKQIYETVINNGKVQQMSTGNNPFALGTT